jgi:D-arabinose 1-dehydrogenase-like Zn-dependent alcohol dehydrogenase
MISFDVCQCGAPLQRMERPTPRPAGTEVLLKVLAAGICHSDLHIWDGYYDMGGGKRIQLLDRGIKLPLTMGHEIVGKVVTAGPDAQGVKPGDRRLAYPWIGCGSCGVCKSGDEQLCLAPRFLGVFANGGYSDHVVVPHARYLLDLDGMPPEKAAPLACSGVTTYGALKKLGATLQRDPVVIIGAGGLGLMCLALANAMGSPGAILVDIDPVKRAAAAKAGAMAVVDGNAPDAAKQAAMLARGAWSVIDLVGSSGTVRLGIDCLTKGGKLIVVGLFGGEVTISTPLIPMKALTIQGSYVGSLAELKELLALVRRTGLPGLPVGTRKLEEADAALGELRAGKVVGRLVLTPAQ